MASACIATVTCQQQSLSKVTHLPGLTEKEHLGHLTRDELRLDLLYPYDHHEDMGYKAPSQNISRFSNIRRNGNQGKKNKENAEIVEESEENLQRKAFFEAYDNSPLYKKDKKTQTTPRKNPLRHFNKFMTSHHKHPNVKSSAYCSRAVDRLKKGPVNIPEKICKKETYVDSDFTDLDQVYWTDFNSYSSYTSYTSQYNSGSIFFSDWSEQYPTGTIFTSNGSLSFNHARQGGAGTCYLIASLGCIGEFPDLVKDMFVTQTKNDQKIIGIRFYIRGKPWVITIDEKILFLNGNTPSMKFAKPSSSLDNMWGAIIEKAWAKVKGNYLNAEGGLVANGLRALTGIPVFMYSTSDIADQAGADTMWETIVAADAANYMMGAGTAGNGNDQEVNGCGIAMSHAYSIISAFSMVEADNTTHKVFLVRNPWGSTYYSSDWYKSDSRWTDALVAQIPYGVDPRTDQDANGLFVVPNSKFIGTNCFDSYEIGHNRAAEGYVETWFDMENDCDNNCTSTYSFKGIDSTSSDIYFTVETYGHTIIPLACTTGIYSYGSTVNYPVVYFQVFKGETRQTYKYYVDQTHKPILIANTNHNANDEYILTVKYEWLGSPHKDYTLKAYSKYSNALITNSFGNINKINMDGKSPSGFTGSSYEGMHDDCARYNPVAATKSIEDTEVKSLMDVFEHANDAGEFFEYLWYNPWVCVVWFHFW